MLNFITIVGRVGKDPEIKYFDSGSCKASFSVAVNRPSKEPQTDWHNIVLWGRNAEIASEYAKKGALVGVTGNLDVEKWKDQEGKNRYKFVIVGDSIQLLGGKKNDQ